MLILVRESGLVGNGICRWDCDLESDAVRLGNGAISTGDREDDDDPSNDIGRGKAIASSLSMRFELFRALDFETGYICRPEAY